MEMEQKRPAGLRIRFCAGLIDLALVAGAIDELNEGDRRIAKGMGRL